MKKNVFTFVFAFGVLIFSTELSAQDGPVLFGLKAGTNLSNYRLGGNNKGFKSSLNIGGTAGGFVKYDLNSNFVLQSGIDVYYKTSKLESKSDKSSDKLKSLGLEVPLYGIFQGQLGSGRIFIGAGPYIGYGIIAKSDGVNLFKKSGDTGKPVMNRFDYGIGAILGYDFDKNWQINASYQFGLADLDKGTAGTLKNQGASIGVAYKF